MLRGTGPGGTAAGIAAAWGGSGSSGNGDLSAFCDDFTGSWRVVESGVQTADALVARVQNEPTCSQAGVDDTNSGAQGAQDAGVIAGESPGSVKDKISAIYEYLLLAVKIAHGDSAAIREVKNDNTYLTDAAQLSGSVPLTVCRRQ